MKKKDSKTKAMSLPMLNDICRLVKMFSRESICQGVEIAPLSYSGVKVTTLKKISFEDKKKINDFFFKFNKEKLDWSKPSRKDGEFYISILA